MSKLFAGYVKLCNFESTLYIGIFSSIKKAEDALLKVCEDQNKLVNRKIIFSNYQEYKNFYNTCEDTLLQKFLYYPFIVEIELDKPYIHGFIE